MRWFVLVCVLSGCSTTSWTMKDCEAAATAADERNDGSFFAPNAVTGTCCVDDDCRVVKK